MGRFSLQNLMHKNALHIMFIPGIVLTFLFSYLPIFGIVMAFQKFSPVRGFFKSDFIGLHNFRLLFGQELFVRTIWNTVYLSLGKIALGLLVPLLLAMLLNELMSVRIKKFIQTTLLAPYFLSWAILAGVLLSVLAHDGPVNYLLTLLHIDTVQFLNDNRWFPAILIGSDVWKGMGMNIVIFLAAITYIDPSLHEAAEVDGANYLQRALNITLPGISPIIVLLFVLGLGNVLNAGFEQVLMMYSPAVYQSADIIDTYVYRLGIEQLQYSVSAAAGLFKSAVSFVLVCVSLIAAHKFTDYRVI